MNCIEMAIFLPVSPPGTPFRDGLKAQLGRPNRVLHTGGWKCSKKKCFARVIGSQGTT